MHRARVFIPSDIALALSEEPSLVQRAAETFYTRDAIQLRVGHMRIEPSSLSFMDRFVARSSDVPFSPFDINFCLRDDQSRSIRAVSRSKLPSS